MKQSLRLQKKLYPSKLINDAVIKAEKTPRSNIINCSSTKNTKELTTLVTTHHPILDNIGNAVISITRQANLPCPLGQGNDVDLLVKRHLYLQLFSYLLYEGKNYYHCTLAKS